jgi:hypothetical protein
VRAAASLWQTDGWLALYALDLSIELARRSWYVTWARLRYISISRGPAGSFRFSREKYWKQLRRVVTSKGASAATRSRVYNSGWLTSRVGRSSRIRIPAETISSPVAAAVYWGVCQLDFSSVKLSNSIIIKVLVGRRLSGRGRRVDYYIDRAGDAL